MPGCGQQHLLYPELAGFNCYDAFRRELAQGGFEFAAEVAGVVFGVQLGVFDAVFTGAEFLGVMAHGGQEIGDADFVREDVGGFAGGFGHPDQVVGWVEGLEGVGFGIELVSEDYDQVANLWHLILAMFL